MTPASDLPTRLRRGQFFGTAHTIRSSRGLALFETRYVPNARLPRHGHESAYLSFVLRGQYTETVGSRTWDCGVNTLRFHPAGEEHADRFGSSGGVCLNIELPLRWLNRMAGGPMRDSLATDECAVAALRLRRFLSHPDADGALTFPELVLALLDGCDRGRTLQRASVRVPWLSRVVDYVEAHLGSRIALHEAAAAAGVHPTHLARTVRARTGGTLGDYVRRRRVARAQAALRARPGRPLSGLAFELGFADHAHFSRTFKAITGLSPQQFRSMA